MGLRRHAEIRLPSGKIVTAPVDEEGAVYVTEPSAELLPRAQVSVDGAVHVVVDMEGPDDRGRMRLELDPPIPPRADLSGG